MGPVEQLPVPIITDCNSEEHSLGGGGGGGGGGGAVDNDFSCKYSMFHNAVCVCNSYDNKPCHHEIDYKVVR